mmetsp:Transcript_23734/g.42019  ORF Transcript_23734/g.42019 Transcript_23734/m.42019 type:complete len:1465 (+) Transcript_23734:1320-5714(+)
MDKQLLRHLDSFTRAKEWEWHDLLSWISKLKGILEGLQSYSLFAVQLTKRLSQCLNPAIPEMVHIASLHIFELLLSKGQCMPLFLDSLLGFFPKASLKLKTAVLGLIQQHCIRTGNELSVSGAVFALLSAANEPEISNQVTDMLDYLAMTYGVAVQVGVVGAILRNRSVRIAGLSYLNRRLKPEVHKLAANAVLASLEDNNLLVQRAALDLLVSHLPLGACDLPESTLVFLATSALKLLVNKDLSLQRRLYEWAFSEEATNYILVSRVVVEALTLHLQRNAPETIEIVAQLLNYNYLTKPLVTELSYEILEYFSKHTASTERIRQIVGENILYGLLNSLWDKIETRGVIKVLDIINYAITELVNESMVIYQTRDRLTSLIGEESLSVCSKVLEIIGSSLLKDAENMSLEAHMKIISRVRSEPELFPQASLIFRMSACSPADEWLNLIAQVSLKKNPTIVHWCIVDLLKSNPDFITSHMISTIWELIETSEFHRVLETLNDCREAAPAEFFASLTHAWLNSSLSVKTRRLREFNKMWKYTRFKLNETSFILMDLLEDPNPQVRHLAHQWLTDSLKCINLIFDPLLEVLLKRQTKLMRSPTGDLQYFTCLDYPRLLSALSRLCTLINRGGEELKYVLQTITISSEARSFSEEVSKHSNTYLDLMCSLALHFVARYEDSDSLNLCSAACEFLELVLHKTNVIQVSRAAEVALKTAVEAIRNDIPVMQLSLVNVLRVVFFECHLPNEAASVLLSSPYYKSLLLPALNSTDPYILKHWVEFIGDCLPLMSQHLKSALLTDYFSSMLSTMSSILQSQADNKPVVGTFVKLIMQSLKNPIDAQIVLGELDTILSVCINRMKQPNLQIKLTKRSLQIDGPLQCPYGDENTDLLVPVSAQYPGQLVSAILNHWVKLTVMKQDAESDLKLQKLLFLTVSLDMPMDRLLGTIFEHLLAKKTAMREGYTEKTELGVAHMLYALIATRIQLSISQSQAITVWETVLKAVNTLECSILGEAKIWGLSLLHLMAKRLPLDEYPKKFKKSLQDTIQRLVSYATGVISSSSEFYEPKPGSCIDATTLGSACSSVLRATCVPLVLVAWSNESEDKIVTQLQGVGLSLLQSYRPKTEKLLQIGEFLVCLVEHEGCCRALKKDLLDLVNQPTFFTDLHKPDEADQQRAVEADLRKSVEALQTYCNIIRQILRVSFPDKSVVITETFSRISTSVFTSRASEIQQTQKALKMMTFFIFSGAIDDFARCASQIFDRLVDLLKEPLLIPSVFMCLRVLLIRLSWNILAECWPRLWPHIFSQLPRSLQRDSSNETCLASIRLLELLSYLGLEDFHLIQWMFFIDVPGISFGDGPSDSFLPCLGQAFLPNYRLEMRSDVSNEQDEFRLTVKQVSYVQERIPSDCTQPDTCPKALSIEDDSPNTQRKKCDNCSKIEAYGKNLIQFDLGYKAERKVLDLASVESLIASEMLV